MYVGCPRLVSSGRFCNIHKTNTQQYRNNSEWKRLSEWVLVEEPICRICGIELAVETDHMIPLPKGSHERWNLQGLCKKCHRIKTTQETRR
jgi:5-methylcytosine-specific restriction endonuclease McrA